ncbi:hypothetical protein, conserved [Babesia bigemina]|uniref:Uncharacterized protein n=1 Tax=Babesia bigemina TaxID=5866 RepID=A0A061D881_BABBI|nr:hypothetical protein, conserved [Babesia bigemina]CDR96192.1 hypothetical protein, conserved [Babesia bigemina]|eukprot:XP_012768378.1 hypothetical protein, conserved [Babesia bigemina]
MVEHVPPESVYRQPNVAELLASLTEQQTHLMETYKGFLDSMRLETNLQEAEGKLSGLKKAGAELIELQKEHITKLLIMLYPIFRVVMPPSQFEQDACIQMLGNRTQLEAYDLVELSCVLRCYFAKLAIYVYHMATFVKDWVAYEHAVSTDPNLHNHGVDLRPADSPESTEAFRTSFNANQAYSGKIYNAEETRANTYGMAAADAGATSSQCPSNLSIVTNVKRDETISARETSEISGDKLISDVQYCGGIVHQNLPFEYPEAQNHDPLYVSDSSEYYNSQTYDLLALHSDGDLDCVEDNLHHINHADAALFADSDRLEDYVQKRLDHEVGLPDITGEYLYSRRESSGTETGTFLDVTTRKLPLGVSYRGYDGLTRGEAYIGASRLSLDVNEQESKAVQPATMRPAFGPPDQLSQHGESEWNQHAPINAMNSREPRFGHDDSHSPRLPYPKPLLISQRSKSLLQPSGDVYEGTPLNKGQEGSNLREIHRVTSSGSDVSRSCDVLCCGVGCQGKGPKHVQTEMPILASETYHPSFYVQRSQVGQQLHVKGGGWNNKDVTYLFYQTPVPMFDLETMREADGSYRPASTNSSLCSMDDKTQQGGINSTVADHTQGNNGAHSTSDVFGELRYGVNGQCVNKSVFTSAQGTNFDDVPNHSDNIKNNNTEQRSGCVVPGYLPFSRSKEKVSYVTRFGAFDHELGIVSYDSNYRIRRVHAPLNDVFMDGVEHSHRSYSEDRDVKGSLASNFCRITQGAKQLGLRHLQLDVRLSQQDKLASETFETSDLEGSSCMDSLDILRHQLESIPSPEQDGGATSHDIEEKKERRNFREDRQEACGRSAVKLREIQCVAIPLPKQSERNEDHEALISAIENPECDYKAETANQPVHALKRIEHSVQPLHSPPRDAQEDNLSSSRIHIPPLDMSKLRARVGY